MNEYRIAWTIYWYTPLTTYTEILYRIPLEPIEDLNSLNSLAEFLSITFHDGYNTSYITQRWINVAWRDVAYYLATVDFYDKE